MIIGYTAGVYDLFHIGHVRLLKKAKSLCDKLIVGVSTDELVYQTKKKKPVISFEERCEVVSSCRYVDLVVPQVETNKFAYHEKLKYDLLFVGDDWYGSDKWKEYDEVAEAKNVRIIYHPYTQGTSSTLINKILVETRDRI